MASFFTRQRPHFFSWWSPQTAVRHPFLMDLDLYPDMTKTSENLSPDSRRTLSVRSGLPDLWFYTCEIIKKIIHRCMSVTELLNVKLFFFCARETVIMMGNTKNRTQEVKDWSEHEIWNSQVKMANVFEKTVIPHMKAMIQSDQLAEVLLSDWLECQFEEQDESDAGSHAVTGWSEEEDGSDSEMSSENREIWESFINNSDPYNPFRLYCATEDKVKASDDVEKKEEEEPVPCCPQEKDETEWSEDEDGSDEGDSEMSSENKKLWESFLNNTDPYNPFCVYSPTEDKVKASDNNNEDDCPQDKDETEWSEEDDSDWSDEGDSEMSAENRELWESFNSDPYNPLCFSCPTGVKTKAAELQQNHTPSSPTVSEEHNPEQSTKERAKKVRFSDEVTVHNLEAWGSASQEARDGSCWLEMARDRERFKRRVEETGQIISTCLAAHQRTRALVRQLCHYEDILAVH